MREFTYVLALVTGLFTSVASAHTVWLEAAQDEDTYDVMFGGHAGKLETLEPKKLELIQAFDRHGNPLSFERRDQQNASQLTFQPDTALVAMYFDNGIWAKGKMGKSINKPMAQVPGATKATYAVKYHKRVLEWSQVVKSELGQTFELIPLSDEQPIAGKPMLVKVLLKGKPLAGVKLGHGEIGNTVETNAQGIAEFIPQSGFNKLWAGKRFQVDEKEYTEMSYEYLFGFYVAKQQ